MHDGEPRVVELGSPRRGCAARDRRVAQPRHALGERQLRERRVARLVAERVEGLVPDQQRRRPRADLRRRCRALARAASSTSASSSRHWSGSTSFWMQREGDRAAGSRAESRRIQSTSCARARRGPRPSRRRARARRRRAPSSPSARPMPNSSSSAANVPGTGSPSIARCTIVREVEKPSAPAAIASRTIAAIARDVLRRRRLVLRAALAHHVGAHRAVRRPACRRRARAACARARRGTRGSVSHSQRDALGERGARDVLDALHEPDQEVAAAPGRTGAKPTPQLPITTVVTPCQHDGVSSGSQVDLAVVVGVDVDEAGRDEQPARVDLLAAAARDRARPRRCGPPSMATSPSTRLARRCRRRPCRRGSRGRAWRPPVSRARLLGARARSRRARRPRAPRRCAAARRIGRREGAAVAHVEASRRGRDTRARSPAAPRSESGSEAWGQRSSRAKSRPAGAADDDAPAAHSTAARRGSRPAGRTSAATHSSAGLSSPCVPLAEVAHQRLVEVADAHLLRPEVQALGRPASACPPGCAAGCTCPRRARCRPGCGRGVAPSSTRRRSRSGRGMRVRRRAHEVQEVEVHAVRVVRVRAVREHPGELRVDVEGHVREHACSGSRRSAATRRAPRSRSRARGPACGSRRRWRRAPRRRCATPAGSMPKRFRKSSARSGVTVPCARVARARLRLGEDHARVALVAVVAGVDVVAELERPGVGRRDVVGLVEGVDGRLPVAGDLERHVVDDRPLLEVVRIEVLGDDAEVVAQRLRVRVEVHEDEAAPGLAAHRAAGGAALPAGPAGKLSGSSAQSSAPSIPYCQPWNEHAKRSAWPRPGSRSRLPRCMQTL